MNEELVQHLQAVLSEVHTLAQNVQLKSTNRRHVLSGALFGRTLEISDGISTMLARQDTACSFILLRSLLEVYVDLQNLIQDARYAEFMHAAWLEQQRRGIEQALAEGSRGRLIPKSGDPDEARKHLEWVRSTLKELKDRGITPLNIRTRFQRAGQLDLYEGPYAHLSWNSHSNLSILEERHIRVYDAGLEVQAFAPICDSDAAILTDTTVDIAAKALISVRRLARPHDGDDELCELEGKLAALRELCRKMLRGAAAPNPAEPGGSAAG